MNLGPSGSIAGDGEPLPRLALLGKPVAVPALDKPAEAPAPWHPRGAVQLKYHGTVDQ